MSNDSLDGDTTALLQEMRKDYRQLASDFREWKQGNHEDKKGIYKRLNNLEEKALYIPNAEESDLIKEAAAFYKAKRELRERLFGILVEKGVTGVILFLAAASFFYVKHLLMEGP